MAEFRYTTRYLPASLQNRWETATFLALAGSISLVLVSIAVSQILLAAAIAGSIYLLKQQKYPLGIRVFVPLLAYMIWTLIAAAASSDPARGILTSKKFYLYLLLAIVPFVLRGAGRIVWTYRAIFAVAIISSVAGIVQFAANPERDLLHRISGFMGHWMTYSGLLMLALVLLASYAIGYGLRRQLWAFPAAGLIIAALLLSQTRNAWLGALAGICLLVIIWRPKALILLIPGVMVFYFLSPGMVKQRIQTGMNPADPNTRNRIELFETSVRLIQDNPWFGVGPRLVSEEALRYRGNNDFPDVLYIHMHNNFLQIAAESGIPGLILWLWFMGQLAWDALLCYRRTAAQSGFRNEAARREALTASSAALASWAALISAGMFEYNFGDSEVLTLFLFITGAPYALLTPSRQHSESLTVPM